MSEVISLFYRGEYALHEYTEVKTVSSQTILLYLHVTHHAKRDLMGIAKSIDPGQSVQSDDG